MAAEIILAAILFSPAPDNYINDNCDYYNYHAPFDQRYKYSNCILTTLRFQYHWK